MAVPEGQNIGFYVMAAPALKGLLDEFRLVVGDEEASESMYRYGKRCGSSLVEALGIKASSVAEAVDTLPMLVAESGLGIGQARTEGDSIIVSLSESLEAGIMSASDIKACSFTSGYLAGIFGTFLGKRCESRQEEYDASGRCIFRLEGCGDVGTPEEKPVATVEEQLPLEEGGTYILKEEKPKKSYELLVRWINAGGKCLCVTRDFPGKIKKNYPVGDTHMVWLSSTEGGGSVDPTKLSSIFFEVQMFMQANPSALVLLSGLEFLVTHNGFLSTLKLVHLISEQASVSGSVILMPINPGAFDNVDLINLERETMPIPDDI